MTSLPTDALVVLTRASDAVGRVLLAPFAFLPGWLSATLSGFASGALVLVAYKYTSNQTGIRRARDRIRAELLALSLFKDDVAVCLRAQGSLLIGALLLLWHSVVPALVMLLPMTLLLGQLSLWYQARPLRVGEEAVLSARLAGDADERRPSAFLEPRPACEVILGPVWIRSRNTLCWNIRAREPGTHRISMNVGGETIDKELAVGDDLMRVSSERPERIWSSVLRHPGERAVPRDAPVQSIAIEYPRRDAWTHGGDAWIVYWGIVTFASALLLRRLFRVHL